MCTSACVNTIMAEANIWTVWREVELFNLAFNSVHLKRHTRQPFTSCSIIAHNVTDYHSRGVTQN